MKRRRERPRETKDRRALTMKRGRGRPRKTKDRSALTLTKGRGRPRKTKDRSTLTLTKGSGRPKDARESGSAGEFLVGSEVEVRSDEDGFRGSWYEATVVGRLRSRYLVEYASLVNSDSDGDGDGDGDGDSGGSSRPLREAVLRSHLRPRPPRSVASVAARYGVDDLVEAYHNDGWWAGVVVEVMAASRRYTVYFPDSEEVIEFPAAELRPKMEWVLGQWVLSTQHQGRRANVSKSPGRKRQSNADVHEKVVDGDEGIPTVSIKRRKEGSSDHDRRNEPSQPGKSSKKGEPSETAPETPQIVETGCRAVMQMLEDSPSSMGKQLYAEGQSIGRTSGARSVATKLPSSTTVTAELSEKETTFKMKAIAQFLNRGKERSGMDSEKSVLHSMAHGFNSSPYDIESVVDFTPIADWRAKGLRTPAANVLQRRKKQAIRVSRWQRDVTSGVSMRALGETKARSTTTKEDITKTMTRGKKVSTDQDTERELGSLDLQLSCPGLSSDIFHDTRELCHINEVMEHEISPLLVIEQDVPDVVDINQSIRMADILGGGGNTSFSFFRDYIIVPGLVAQQLSNMRSSLFEPTVDDCLAPCDWLSEARPEVEDEVPVSLSLVNSGDAHHQLIMPIKDCIVENERTLTIPPKELPQKEIILPFMKCSSMWQSIESMEVFKILPQQPHFEPLKSYGAGLREGMAIGLMLSFESLVSNIRNLKVDDAQAIFDEKLETLNFVEQYGFDVQRVRSRIKELLEIRSNQRKHETKKEKLVEKILDRKVDSDILDAVTVEYDGTIGEITRNLIKLQRQRKDLRDRRTSVVSRRESCNSVMSKLQSDLWEAEVAQSAAESHFENALAAPL